MSGHHPACHLAAEPVLRCCWWYRWYWAGGACRGGMCPGPGQDATGRSLQPHPTSFQPPPRLAPMAEVTGRFWVWVVIPGRDWAPGLEAPRVTTVPATPCALALGWLSSCGSYVSCVADMEGQETEDARGDTVADSVWCLQTDRSNGGWGRARGPLGARGQADQWIYGSHGTERQRIL